MMRCLRKLDITVVGYCAHISSLFRKSVSPDLKDLVADVRSFEELEPEINLFAKHLREKVDLVVGQRYVQTILFESVSTLV